jgi:hypothetical protein
MIIKQTMYFLNEGKKRIAWKLLHRISLVNCWIAFVCMDHCQSFANCQCVCVTIEFVIGAIHFYHSFPAFSEAFPNRASL